MSIAVEVNRNRIEEIPYDMPGRLGMLNSAFVAGDQRGSGYGGGSSAVSNHASSTTSTSSSIGNNSEDLDGKSSSSSVGADGDEVQSSLKSTFDDAMDALEEALPNRGGISRFYSGKSRSFASLADASACASIKDITKPENAYTRKRKNLLAYSLLWDKKPSSSSLLLRSHGGGISKRPTSSSRSTLMRASIDETMPDSGSSCKTFSPLFSPPRFPRGTASAWRSFSVADLQHCSNAVKL